MLQQLQLVRVMLQQLQLHCRPLTAAARQHLSLITTCRLEFCVIQWQHVDILVFNPQQLSPAPAVLIALSPICVPLLPSALTRPYPAITSLFTSHSATSELLCKPEPWKLQTAMNAELTRIWRCREGGQSSQVFDPNFYDPLCSTFNLIWKSIFSLKVAALSATLVLSCCGESGLKSEIKWRDQNNDKLFGFAKMIPSTILGLKIVQTATAAAVRRENEEF